MKREEIMQKKRINLKRMGAIALMAIGLSGCVTVESLRAKLNSGDIGQEKAAEETITAILCDSYRDPFGSPRYSTVQEKLEYQKIVTDQEMLRRIFVNSDTRTEPAVLDAIVQRFDFSKPGSLLVFLKEVDRRYQSSPHEEDVTKSLLKRMIKTAPWEEMERVVECYLGDDQSISHVVGALRSLLIPYVAMKTNNKNLLVDIIAKDILPEKQEKKALARLTQEELLSVIAKANNNVSSVLGGCLSFMTPETVLKYAKRAENLSEHEQDMVLGKLREKDIVELLKSRRYRYGSSFEWMWERIFKHIKAPDSLAVLAVDAKGEEARLYAASKLKDPECIASVFKSGSQMDEEVRIALINNMEKGSADFELYKLMKGVAEKSALYSRLSDKATEQVRAMEKPQCEKLIAKARKEGERTFAFAGFYLGMSIEDAGLLLRYYFPKIDSWISVEKGISYLSVKGQRYAFAKPDETGHVVMFRFGPKLLKKWYNYDVQTSDEWASEYEKDNNIHMVRNSTSTDNQEEIMASVSLGTFGTLFGPSSYKSAIQDTYSYKYNSKHYKLTYFGDAEGDGVPAETPGTLLIWQTEDD